MKTNKMLIPLFILLLVITPAFAAWEDSLLSYWSFDSTYTNNTNATSHYNNVTAWWQGTPPTNVSCIVNECRYFSAATSYLNVTKAMMLNTSDTSYSSSAWIYPTTT